MTDPAHRRGRTRRRSPRGPLRVWLTTMLSALGLALSAIGVPATAHARGATISPGDELDPIQAHGGTRCTLGYTFTDPGTTINYGITDGHCNKGSDHDLDRTTGAI